MACARVRSGGGGRFWLILLVVGLWVTSGAAPGAAQEPYPTRPITLVVPFAPGGVADLGSRIVADKMSEALGQRMVAEYKPGGGGSLGVSWVARAKPDGYTLLAAQTGPLVFTPAIRKVDYSVDDFILIGAYAQVPQWLLVKGDSRWKTLKDFVEEARRTPGKLIVASYGKMTTVDFGIQLLNKYAGINVAHVPYKSSGEAVTAVLGGNADAAFVSGAGGQFGTGSVRILAVAEKTRLEAAPDVPTFSEFGYPIVIPAWHSFAVPKGTPRHVIERLYEAQKHAFEKGSVGINERLLKVEVFGRFLDFESANQAFRELRGLFVDMATQLGVAVR